MDPDADAVPVVQPRAFELGICEVESEWADEVERDPGRGARPRDRAGVARDLWGHEDDREVVSLVIRRGLDGADGVEGLLFSRTPIVGGGGERCGAKAPAGGAMPRRETRAEARAESTRDRQRRQRGRRHLTRCLTSARGVRGALGRMRVDTVPFVVDIFQTGNTTSHPSPTPHDPHLPLPIAPVSGSSYLPWATAPSPPACHPSAGTGRTSAVPASTSPACGRYYFPSRSFPWRDGDRLATPR